MKQRPRPAQEWTRNPVDENLRIIPDDLWTRVASRRADTEGRTIRFESGRMSGRPPKYAVQNLLAGLAACGVCGGGLVVETSSRKNGRVAEYVCHRHRHNSTCTNALRMPVADMNEAVLQVIEEHVFTPEAVEQVIALTERDELRERQDALRAEYKDVERRIARLTAVVESEEGAGIQSLLSKLRTLEQRKAVISSELEALQPVPRLPQTVVQNRLDEWRRLLRGSVTQGRAVLQRVLRGRITFTPRTSRVSVVLDGQDVELPLGGYDFVAPTRMDKLFAGIAVRRPTSLLGDTTGCDGILPADTLDRDYGALLERVYGKRLASPTGIAPFTAIGRVLRRAA